MKAREFLESISTETGWNESSKINLLCDYIDSLGTLKVFKSYIERRAEEESQVEEGEEETCTHENTYISDRNTVVCCQCGEDLGR